jgi:hypothetical protein
VGKDTEAAFEVEHEARSPAVDGIRGKADHLLEGGETGDEATHGLSPPLPPLVSLHTLERGAGRAGLPAAWAYSGTTRGQDVMR